jgi:hypothetical protein
VEDYNNRPHSVHKVLSPNEVYAVTDTYDYQSLLKKGMTNRRMVNSQCASQNLRLHSKWLLDMLEVAADSFLSG